jgi:hypothetical protein
MREFYGNTDSDREVEGWDYARGRSASSDDSHLWHIHISVHRKYVADKKAMRAILSILKGESTAQWLVAEADLLRPPEVPADMWNYLIASPSLGVAGWAANDWLKKFEEFRRESLALLTEIRALRASFKEN